MAQASTSGRGTVQPAQALRAGAQQNRVGVCHNGCYKIGCDGSCTVCCARIMNMLLPGISTAPYIAYLYPHADFSTRDRCAALGSAGISRASGCERQQLLCREQVCPNHLLQPHPGSTSLGAGFSVPAGRVPWWADMWRMQHMWAASLLPLKA